MKVTSNVKYIPAGVTQYIVDGNDGEINVDTSVSAVTIILPNIINSGYTNTDKGFIINDFSGNAGTNNITLVASNNTVNSQSSVLISVNGGTAKCSIASMNEWFVITEPSTSGMSGTLTANYIPKAATSSTLTNSIIYQDGHNIAIGTTTAVAKLHVLQNTVGTGAKAFSVNFATIGETFYLDDNGYAYYYGGGFTVAGSNAILNLVSNGGVSPSIKFKYNNGASTSGFLYGVGASMFFETPAFGLGSSYFNPQARFHVQGVNSTSANFALKVDNSASSPLLYVRNDGNVYSHGVGSIVTNTAFGLNSLLSNLTGSDNTVYGVNAMRVNTTGTNNTAVGVNALYNSNGSFNTATGYISLESNTGDRNTAFGYGSLSVNTTGIRNTAVGMFAGNVNSVGDDNVFIGYNANALSNNLTNAIAIGYNATVSSSNSMVLGEGVNVGIGIPSPAAKLHIKGADATSANYALKVDNLALNPLFYVRNDGMVGIGTIPSNIQLEVVSSDNSPYGFSIRNNTFSSNAANGYKFYQENDGRIISYNNSQLLFAYGASGNIMFSNSQNTISSDTKVVIQAISDGSSNYSLYARGNSINSGLSVDGNGNVGINQLTAGAKLHIKGIDSTSSNYALKVDNSASLPLIYVRNDGLISTKVIQPAYGTLVAGDLYYASAATILANGDEVVGRKV